MCGSDGKLLDPVDIARWMIEREFIRQMPLKSLQQFDRFGERVGSGSIAME